MKYKRIDENTLAIYVSERDIYDADLNISQLFTADQKEAHDVIYNLLKKADPDGDFSDGGQLSIQMMPRKKGLVINVQKIPNSGEQDDQDNQDFIKMAGEQAIKSLGDINSLLKVVDDLVEEQAKEDAEKDAKRIAYILGKTKRFEDIIQLAKLGTMWHTAEQFVYYNQGIYYMLFKYPQGMDSQIVNQDFMIASEWLDFEIKSLDEVLNDATLVMKDNNLQTVMEQLQSNF